MKFLLPFLLSCSVAFASNYYVATTGNDSAAGTIGAPWLTVQHAASTVIAGDSVYIRGGTYSESVSITKAHAGTVGNYVTFASYQNEDAIIQSTSGSYPLQIYDATGWTEYIKLDGSGADGGRHLRFTTATSDRCVMIRYAAHIWMRNCEVDGAVGNDDIKLTSNNQGTDSGGTDDNTGSRFCLIENCLIRNGGDYGIKVTGWGTSSNLFLSNLIANNGGRGSSSYGVNVSGSGYEARVPTANTFFGNTIISNYHSGLQFTVTCSNVVSSNAFVANGNSGDGGHGMSFGTAAWGNRSEHNSSYGNKGYGLLCDGYASTNILAGNALYDNLSGGIRIQGTSTWCRVINNTVLHTNTGYAALYIGSNCSNQASTNNIFYVTTSDPCVNVQTGATITSDYNRYYRVAGSTPIYYLGTWYTVTDFHTATGNETHSSFGDPGLASFASRDLYLSPSSPCINAGAQNGWPFSGAAPDIGAYEWTGYYVDISGNNANPGTPAEPWRNVWYSALNATAGSLVSIGVGTFNEFVTNTASGDPGNPITFSGAANWTTIIDPSTALTNGWVLDASMSNGVYSNTAPWQVAEMELDSKQVMFVYSTGNIAAALQSAWPTIALTTGAQLLSSASNFAVTPYYNNVPVPFWDGVEALWSSASDHTVWLRLRDGSDPNGRNIRVSPNGSPAGGLRSEELLAPAIYIGASNIVWQNVLVRGARGQILLDGTAANNVVIRSNYLSGGVQRILAQNGCWSNTIIGNVFASDFYGGTNIGAWSGQNSVVYAKRESTFYELPKHIMGNGGSLGYDFHAKHIGDGIVIVWNTLLPGAVGIEIEGDVAAPTFYLTIASNYISSHASLAVALHDGVTQASVFENTMIDNNLSIREHDMGQTDETNRVHLIYRNRSWQPAAGEHVYFYWVGQIPGGNYHPEIWIYNNSFAGGVYAVDLGIELDWNDGGARNVRIANNIADENFIYTYDPFKSNASALKADYNLKLVTPFYNGAYEGSHTLTNNATEWPAGIIPNWALRSGSLARNAALDVTVPFTLQGTSFPALPLTGTKSGPAWDIGAVESGSVFRVTNLRIVNLNQ